nr:Scr1 family TA system antitoxin-like transcriptional regulator [Streptomyces exfoliatus]
MAFLAERQQVLGRQPAPMPFVVMDESCIRRMVGGPDVVATQLDRLVELATSPFTVLQVAIRHRGEALPQPSREPPDSGRPIRPVRPSPSPPPPSRSSSTPSGFAVVSDSRPGAPASTC